MRAEEKELEVEVEVAQEREVVAEEMLEVEAPAIVEVEEVAPEIVEEVRDEHREVLLATIMAIFEGEKVSISELDLPQRELAALHHLETAVSGREQLGRFVYADDRRTMLEHALAVLQPDLASIEAIEMFSGRVEDLRETLEKLGDAQGEIPEYDKEQWFGDHEDLPPPAKPDEDQSLDGPERPAETKESTLAKGPAVEIESHESMLSKGPAAPDLSSPPSTLTTGPAVADKTPSPSTLDTGAPIAEDPPPPSTLTGDAPPTDPRASTAAAEPKASKKRKRD